MLFSGDIYLINHSAGTLQTARQTDR